MTCALDVPAHDRLVDVARQLPSTSGFSFTNRKNGEPLGGIATTSTSISERVGGAEHEVRTQRDRATEVVRHDVRALQPPVLEQRRQRVGLRAEVHRMVRCFDERP